jgi:hypothetical protein
MKPRPETEFLSATGRIYHNLNWKTPFLQCGKDTLVKPSLFFISKSCYRIIFHFNLMSHFSVERTHASETCDQTCLWMDFYTNLLKTLSFCTTFNVFSSLYKARSMTRKCCLLWILSGRKIPPLHSVEGITAFHKLAVCFNDITLSVFDLAATLLRFFRRNIFVISIRNIWLLF